MRPSVKDQSLLCFAARKQQDDTNNTDDADDLLSTQQHERMLRWHAYNCLDVVLWSKVVLYFCALRCVEFILVYDVISGQRKVLVNHKTCPPGKPKLRPDRVVPRPSWICSSHGFWRRTVPIRRESRIMPQILRKCSKHDLKAKQTPRTICYGIVNEHVHNMERTMRIRNAEWFMDNANRDLSLRTSIEIFHLRTWAF